MGRLISYIFIFVCGFAACALILQRTSNGNGISLSGLSGDGATAKGRESIARALDKDSNKPSTRPISSGLTGTDLVADAAAKVEPAVVNIDIEGTRNSQGGPFGFLQGQSEAFEGSGSGIILSGDGYVVTNNHVIEPVAERGTEGGQISIRLDNGKQYRDVSIIGRDPQSDLAVLKINGVRSLPAAVLGDSDRLRVGDWAIAVGNPLGFNSTVTLGIVSALNRRDFRAENDALDRVIQTDAAINPGNSGGALANISGEIVGINTAIASSTGASVGIGFAIPINSAKRIIKQLVGTGKVTRPYLGVAFSPVDGVDRDSLPERVQLPPDSQGALVINRQGRGSAVAPGSPAAQAGIRDYDVIRAIDGKTVKDINDVKEWVQQHNVGETVNITLWRAGKTLNVPVKLQVMPSDYGRSMRMPRPDRLRPEARPFGGLPNARPEVP